MLGCKGVRGSPLHGLGTSQCVRAVPEAERGHCNRGGDLVIEIVIFYVYEGTEIYTLYFMIIAILPRMVESF